MNIIWSYTTDHQFYILVPLKLRECCFLHRISFLMKFRMKTAPQTHSSKNLWYSSLIALLLVLEKVFRTNCSASSNLLTRIIFWPILKIPYISFDRITLMFQLWKNFTLHMKKYNVQRDFCTLLLKHIMFFRLLSIF